MWGITREAPIVRPRRCAVGEDAIVLDDWSLADSVACPVWRVSVSGDRCVVQCRREDGWEEITPASEVSAPAVDVSASSAEAR